MREIKFRGKRMKLTWKKAIKSKRWQKILGKMAKDIHRKGGTLQSNIRFTI